jgi:hypothetical protein
MNFVEGTYYGTDEYVVDSDYPYEYMYRDSDNNSLIVKDINDKVRNELAMEQRRKEEEFKRRLYPNQDTLDAVLYNQKKRNVIENIEKYFNYGIPTKENRDFLAFDSGRNNQTNEISKNSIESFFSNTKILILFLFILLIIIFIQVIKISTLFDLMKSNILLETRLKSSKNEEEK